MTPLQRMILIGPIIVFGIVSGALNGHAHDWYTGTRDPVTQSGCCGGHDCAAVPLDADWIRPVAEGLRVVMTLEQSKQVNPYSQSPVDTVVPWSRVQSPPADASGPPAIYHVCIAAYQRIQNGGVYCLFAVPSL